MLAENARSMIRIGTTRLCLLDSEVEEVTREKPVTRHQGRRWKDRSVN